MPICYNHHDVFGLRLIQEFFFLSYLKIARLLSNGAKKTCLYDNIYLE